MLRLFLPAIALLAVTACSKKSDSKSSDKKVVVKAGSLALNPLTLKDIAGQLLLGPEDPSYADGEYDGMGVNTSDAVVEGFKIQLTSVTFGSGTKTASPFSISDGILDISEGVNSTISVEGTLPSMEYDRVSVAFKPWYKLKAYAYMDSDNNGSIDKTVFTTATEVKASDGRLTKAELTAAGYDEYEYGFAYIHCSDSITASTTEGSCGTISVFPEPFNIDAPIESEEGETPPETHVVNILIDSTKVVNAWLGTTGNYLVKGDETTSEFLGTGQIPLPVAGFPLSDTCSDTKNQWGLNTCDFFPLGKPAFKLQYLPAFAFLSTSGLSSQVYSVSTEAGIWNHYNSGTLQLVFKDDVPQLGLSFSNLNGDYDFSVSPAKLNKTVSPVIGSVARLFESTGTGVYTFYMDYGSTDANGNNDGGLYYNNDKAMAGFIAEGFTPGALGATSTITVKDGPRCKSEYDLCIGDRTYYLKRIR